MEESNDTTATDAQAVLDMFDEDSGPGVTCRVCGSLVADTEAYRQAHWDWHEAPNGA
jgi:hypothetical protein